MFVFPRHLGEHGYLIEGTVTLTKEILDKHIPYKYCVTSGKEDYEFIYKNPESSDPVNRCLMIKKLLLNNGGELCWLDLHLGVIPAVGWPSIPVRQRCLNLGAQGAGGGIAVAAGRVKAPDSSGCFPMFSLCCCSRVAPVR